MSRRVSSISQEVTGLLTAYAEPRPGWDYVKSQRSFIKKVSRAASVVIGTQASSKGSFVTLEMSIQVRHSLMKKVGKVFSPHGGILGLVVSHNKLHWTDETVNGGRGTVYRTSHIFDGERAKGKSGYLYPEELHPWLDRLFPMAEAEIDRLFDTSSEEALIRSTVAHPIGFFFPEQVLEVQLALNNPGYYDELIAYYDQPLEVRQKVRRFGMSRDQVDRMMEIYRQTDDFPTFSFA